MSITYLIILTEKGSGRVKSRTFAKGGIQRACTYL